MRSKDIRDEVTIILGVLHAQDYIAYSLFQVDERFPMTRDVCEYYRERSGLDQRFPEVGRMDEFAERTHNFVGWSISLCKKLPLILLGQLISRS